MRGIKVLSSNRMWGESRVSDPSGKGFTRLGIIATTPRRHMGGLDLDLQDSNSGVKLRESRDFALSQLICTVFLTAFLIRTASFIAFLSLNVEVVGD